MTLLTRIERKFGWMAIGQLPVYIVSAQALIYVWALLNPGQIHRLTLNPVAVVQGGEVWRLLTFLFIVPARNPIFAFFYLYLFYIYGSALEREWGSFRFTIFYLVGAVGTIVTAFLFGNAGGSFFLNLTIFLAFAALYPDFVLYLFFILPVKIKWIAWATWAWVAYSFALGGGVMKATILVSIANYLLFFSRHHYENVKTEIERIRHRRRFKNWGE